MLKKHNYISIFLFLTIFVVAYGIFNILHEHEKLEEQQRIKLNGLHYSSVIQRRLENAIASLYALNLAVVQNAGTNKNFHLIAKDILKKHPFVIQVNLAPQGIIRDIEPLEGNENIIGLNVLKRDQESRNAQRAKETGALILSEPLNLIQGGQGLLAYLPVNLVDEKQNSHFWGFTTMLIQFPEIIAVHNLFEETFLEKFHYQIWSISPFDTHQKNILQSSISTTEIEQAQIEPYDFTIEIPNGNWTLSIYPKSDFNSDNTSLYITFICLLAMVATFLIKRTLRKKYLENIKLYYQEDHAAFEKACVFTETSTNGIILRVNDKLEEISGYSKAELIGNHQSIFRSGVHSNEFYRHLWSVITKGEIWQGEICNKTKNGDFYWVFTIIVPVADAQGNVKKFFAFMTDITKQKQTEERKNDLQAQLFQSQKMETIGHLTSGIAHDFNNILMAVIGFTSLGLSFIQKQQYEQAFNAFTKVENSARRATSLVDKMLTFCRENTIKADAVIDPAVIIQEVFEIGEMLRSGISSSIRLEFNNAIEDKDIGILIDPSELHQLVTNLIINARDAIESNNLNNSYISVDLFVEHVDMIKCSACGVKFSGSFVTLSVTDTGIGIPKENIANIFDPFYSTKEVGKGTGLGLSVVSGIVKNVGGHITVESVVNEGTTISLLFPIVTHHEIPSVDTTLPTLNPSPLPEREHRSSIKLLIVEDDESICDLFNFEFTNLGYQVTCFNNSLEAWTQFSQDDTYFDAVISDYGMPQANGLDLSKLILGIRPTIPIFICTGYSDKLKSDRDLPKGNTFLYKKPVDIDTLDKAIKKFFL